MGWAVEGRRKEGMGRGSSRDKIGKQLLIYDAKHRIYLHFRSSVNGFKNTIIHHYITETS